MMIANRWFGLLGGIVLTLFAMEIGTMSAAEPQAEPSPEFPVGYLEWQKTKAYPAVLELTGAAGKVMLPTPDGQAAHYAISDAARSSQPGFSIGCGKRFPLEDARHAASPQFELGPRQRVVVPIFGQLYVAQYTGARQVRLTRVTHRVPADLRPGERSRTIAASQVGPTLFWTQDPTHAKRKEFDSISGLQFDDDQHTASLRLVPGVALSGPGPSMSERKPMELTVRKGDLLSARDRAYRVLNVVAPQEIEGVGRLAGWIEISTEPLRPTEES